jgi:hypothetical protein
MAFREYKVADQNGKEVLTVVASTEVATGTVLTPIPKARHLFIRFPDSGVKPIRLRNADYYPAEWFTSGLNAAMFNVANFDQLVTALTEARAWLQSQGVE